MRQFSIQHLTLVLMVGAVACTRTVVIVPAEDDPGQGFTPAESSFQGHPYVPGSEAPPSAGSSGSTGFGGGSRGSPSAANTPKFGPTVSLDTAPPALGAASLVLTQDGTTAIATDPDRDRVLVVELGSKTVKEVAFEAGAEPGRLALDDAGRAHVVLDRAGAVVTIDLSTANVLARRSVCGAPQGIARQGAQLFVACAGGEIVSMAANPEAGKVQVIARVDRDLRDVVAVGADLLVSRFRTAEVVRVRIADGVVLSRAGRPRSGARDFEANVAWRLVPAAEDGAVLVHQLAKDEEINVSVSSSYGGSEITTTPAVVTTTVTSFSASGSPDVLSVSPHAILNDAVVPIDLARSTTGERWAVIAAGNSHLDGHTQVQVLSTLGGGDTSLFKVDGTDPNGESVAAAFTPDDRLVVFTREPAALHLRAVDAAGSAWETIPLGGASCEDTGHAIFHSNAGKGIACASCHPAGADDGRVWKFSTGNRRTQSLLGTLDGTGPYHWSGDMPSLEHFGPGAYTGRMGGQELTYAELTAMRRYLTRLPAPPRSAPGDAQAAARGKALFLSQTAGCTGCHSGEQLTNSESVDVGTGGKFQVPSLLGVAQRAPFLHDGRAATLLDRFGPAGGGDKHGQTSALNAADLTDLVTYLESL